jgi:hypothetical protein
MGECELVVAGGVVVKPTGKDNGLGEGLKKTNKTRTRSEGEEDC